MLVPFMCPAHSISYAYILPGLKSQKEGETQNTEFKELHLEAGKSFVILLGLDAGRLGPLCSAYCV